ncbi:MAG: SDR family NAD(P)-dependent oxidoreductase [Gammaproteobacteria bacterium]
MLNILVTGASRGLGLAIARKLAAEEYNVIGIARAESREITAAMLEAERGERGALRFIRFDLTDIGGIRDLVKRLRKEFGPIYGLVNNVGLGTSGLLATMHDTRIENLVHLNVLSPLILTKYVVRSMMTDGGGRIVNIASIVSFTGYKGLAAYAATKASMIGFTRSLAREVGSLGINVNAIAPGFMDTEMTQGLTAKQSAQILRRSALGRLAQVEDIANAVEYLIGEKGRNITGTVMTIDAGNTA